MLTSEHYYELWYEADIISIGEQLEERETDRQTERDRDRERQRKRHSAENSCKERECEKRVITRKIYTCVHFNPQMPSQNGSR